MAVPSGTRLGPYEIIGPLGSGGMGEVYRARDTRLGRDVAVKVLSEDTAGIPERLSRFDREARAVAALNHPNILALHDIGTHGGVVYAVTELLEGETLRARLKASGRLSPLKAINYAVQIARGLAAAHERGILHRDLKPENLFITTDGRVKILDFGLAQQEAAAASGETSTTHFTTQPGTVLGTPGYMSPEQVVGQPATARSDIFSFGVVAYEMLTGSHPFQRATISDTVTAILRDDPPPLARILPELPAGLVGILESCLDKHPADRPASARDLALFFEAAGSSSNESGTWQRVVPSDLRRLRYRLVAIACGLLILLSAVTWGFVGVMANRTVAAAVEGDLTHAERFVERVHQDRLSAVGLTARLVAWFPELRALFVTDVPTIRDFLVTQQQRNPDSPLLIALGPDGAVMARTDAVLSPAEDDARMGALVKSGEPAIIALQDGPYHAAPAAVEAGGNVFGHIVAARPIDDRFAVALREATQDEVVILSDTGMVASTLRAGQAPWQSLKEWSASGGRDEGISEVSIGAQRFAARETRLGDSPAIAVILLTSRDEAIAPFRRIQTGVILIGLLCAVIAAAGSLWIGRTLASACSPRPGNKST